jgi:thioredoxin reductase
VGAGPYGLSIAAYLRARGIPVRIFGRPMDTWRERMPKGMFLKSEGFASSLYDPKDEFGLEVFCRDAGIPYADWGLPVSLDTFTSYGLAFAKKFVPDLDPRDVVRVARHNGVFDVELDGGETIQAGRVIVAAGISHFAYVPPMLSELPEELAVHSSRHHDYGAFAGKRVAVVGGGASAVDVALSLHEAGASTELIARRPKLAFHDPPLAKRSILDRLLYPRSGIGCGVRSRFFTDMPDLFARFPRGLRAAAVRTHLGPAPCWFTKEKFEPNVTTHLGVQLERAEPRDGGVRLQLRGTNGQSEVNVDRVIAATGYRVDLARLGFLDSAISGAVSTYEGSPILNRNFESSVPGLYFVGLSAANTFGPMLRFAFGARFAAARLRAHLSGVRFASD